MYKPLKLSCKEEHYKPDILPPNDASEAFSQIIVGARGQGKTYLMLQFLQNILRYNYYNMFFLISSTYKSDIKVKKFYEELEEQGYLVYRYKNFTADVINEIQQIMKEKIKEWRKYQEIKKIIDKVKKKQNVTDEELEIIQKYVDDPDEFEVEDLIGLLDEFDPAIMREIPPTSHLLVDDFYGSHMLSKRSGPFVNFWIRHRHKRCSISLLVQALPPIRTIRINTVLWFIFPTKNQKQISTLYEENSGIFKSLEHFKNIMDKVESDGKRNFLYLDCSDTTNPDVRSGLNNKLSIKDYE